MDKYLIQVKVPNKVMEFISERKSKKDIRTHKQYFMYLLEKDGYKTNHKDL